MKTKSYQSIFREFLRMCPYVKNEVVGWRKGEDYEIIAELEDGSAYRYDSLNKTFRWVPSSREFARRPRDEDEWKYRFSRRLYKKMHIAGINQDYLSFKTGLSNSTISKYVNGEVIPSVYKVQQIADVLGCTVDDLINFD